MKINKYIYAFIITATLFFSGVYLVSKFTESKLNTVRNIETDIAINILSLETQFALLQELSCADISKSILSSELDALAKKLNYMENNLSEDDEELNKLKRYYSLLEIKDFILMQKINSKCGRDLDFVLYFYTNDGSCRDCKKQGRDLTRLLMERDNLRVYSFDYNTELSAIDTLKKIYKVKPSLPALVINNKTYHGGISYEDLQTIISIKENDE